MSKKATLIEASGICKQFAGQAVLEDVDFRITEREVVTIVGLNGCGKTTLLRILLGLEKPDSGGVTHKPGLKIGYLPQRFHIDPVLPMTVVDFLHLGAQSQSAFANAVRELQIEGLLDKAVQTLSGGETQRMLLARAMMREPELLVLDEPVQGVDIAGQTELYQLIGSLSKRHKCAVLMVSHDLHLVMAATDNVICLNRHVCCSGHPHKVSKDPAFLQLFGARVAASLAVYEHHHDHAHEVDGSVHEHGEHCKHD